MDRWRFTPLDKPLQFTIHNFTKVALAADSDAAALAIFPHRKLIHIVGMVDQQHKVNAFRRYESEGSYHPPGTWHESQGLDTSLFFLAPR